MPAPNGIELAAALCVWVSLLGILRLGSSTTSRNGLALVLGVGGIVLATVRTLGPLWLGLIVAACLLAGHRRRVLSVLRKPTSAQWLAGASTVGAVCASAWWIVSERQVASLERIPAVDINPLVPALKEVPLWVFQSIAAFPLRNEPAPIAVYVLSLVLLTVLMTAALRQAGKKDRWTLAAISVGALPCPLSSRSQR